MRIKMLIAVGDHAKGATVPVEDSVGQKYIAAGFAEAAPPEDPTEKMLETYSKMATLTATATLDEYEKRFGGDGAATKHPGRVRIDAGEAERDKQKSLSDHLRLITIAGCPNIFPGKQAEAVKELEDVYSSSYKAIGNAKPVTKDLAEGSGTTGGYTVAPLYASELLQLGAERSIVRPYANVKQLPGREGYYPMLNQTVVPSGTQDSPQTAIVGGVIMSWGAEAQPPGKTAPNFKQVHVATNPVYGLCGLSRFLLADSMIAMDAELRNLFANAIAWTEDYAFLQGNGNDKPLGILNAPATITYPSRAASNKFQLADAANMAGAMIPDSRTMMVWIATNNLFSQIIQLVDASGRVTYVNNVGTGYGEAKLMAGQTGLLMLGRPVLFTEKLPAVGTAGDIIAADLSKYLVANSGTLEIMASDQFAFDKNQITYRVILRVDGQPQIDAPYTLPDGTTQNSPFVILHA